MVAHLTQTRGGAVSYTLPDGQGSVRQLANSSGTVTDTYRYDAYGTVTSHSGTTTEPYQYDSQRLDATSRLWDEQPLGERAPTASSLGLPCARA